MPGEASHSPTCRPGWSGRPDELWVVDTLSHTKLTTYYYLLEKTDDIIKIPGFMYVLKW